MLDECREQNRSPKLTEYIAALGKIKRDCPALSEGRYKELLLTNRQYAFARIYKDTAVITAVNNDSQDAHMEIAVPVQAAYGTDGITGKKYEIQDGKIRAELAPGGTAVILINF